MRVEQQNQILEALQQAAGKDVKTASPGLWQKRLRR